VSEWTYNGSYGHLWTLATPGVAGHMVDTEVQGNARERVERTIYLGIRNGITGYIHLVALHWGGRTASGSRHNRLADLGVNT